MKTCNVDHCRGKDKPSVGYVLNKESGYRIELCEECFRQAEAYPKFNSGINTEWQLWLYTEAAKLIPLQKGKE